MVDGYTSTLAVQRSGSVLSFQPVVSDEGAAYAEISGLPPAPTQLAACESAHFALYRDGTVWSWGEASRGQLGLGSTVDRVSPTRVTAMPSAVAVGCGRDHTLAVGSDGRTFAWGQNDYGQLGDATLVRRPTPVVIPGLTRVAEAHGGRGYTVVRRLPA